MIVSFSQNHSRFPATATIFNLTFDELGLDGCGYALNELRRLAEDRVGRECEIQVFRAPETGQRLGYRVHTAHQVDADAVRANAQRVVDNLRLRQTR